MINESVHGFLPVVEVRLERESVGSFLSALHRQQFQFAGSVLALVVLVVLVAAGVAVGAFEFVLELLDFLLQLAVEFVDPLELVLVELLEGVVLVAQEVVQRELQVAVHLYVAVYALLQLVVLGLVETQLLLVHHLDVFGCDVLAAGPRTSLPLGFHQFLSLHLLGQGFQSLDFTVLLFQEGLLVAFGQGFAACVAVQISLGSDPMDSGVQFLVELVQSRLDCALDQWGSVALFEYVVLRVRMKVLLVVVGVLLFEEFVLSLELVDDLIFKDMAVFDLLVVGAKGAVHVQPEHLHLVIADLFSEYLYLLVAVVMLPVLLLRFLQLLLHFVQSLVPLLQSVLQLPALAGELLVLPDCFRLPTFDAFDFLGGPLLELPQFVALPRVFFQQGHLLLELPGCALELVSGLLLVGAAGGQFLAEVFEFMRHPAYFLLVVVVDLLQLVELVLVLLEAAAVGADDGLVLLVDVLLAFQFELDVGVVGLSQLQRLRVLADLDVLAGQQILQAFDFLVEVVGCSEFSGAFLLVVEFVGHFAEFFVLLDHDVPELLVLLAEDLVLAGVLLLLQQHFPHLHEVAVLLVQHLQQLLVLVLQVVVLVQLPPHVLVLDLLLVQAFLAFQQLLLELLHLLTQAELLPLPVEHVLPQVVQLASQFFGHLSHAVVHGVDGGGVDVDLPDWPLVVHECELVLEVPHDGVLLVEVALQQRCLFLEGAYELVLLVGHCLQPVDELRDLQVGHLQFAFVGLVSEVEFGVQFADVHFQLHHSGVVVEGFHAAAFQQRLRVVAALHGRGRQMAGVFLRGAGVLLHGAGVVELPVVLLLPLFAFGLEEVVPLLQLHLQHQALLVHALQLLLVLLGEFLQSAAELLVFGLEEGDQHGLLLEGGLHRGDFVGPVLGGLRHDRDFVVAPGVSEFFDFVGQSGYFLLSLLQEFGHFVGVLGVGRGSVVEGVLQLLYLLEVSLVFVQFGVVLGHQLLVGHLKLRVVLLQRSELAAQYLHLPALLHLRHFPPPAGLLILLLPVRSLPERLLVVVALAEEGAVGGTAARPFDDDLGGRDVGVEHGVSDHHAFPGGAVVEIDAHVGTVDSAFVDVAVPQVAHLLGLDAAVAHASQLAHHHRLLAGRHRLLGWIAGVQRFETLGLDWLPHHCDVGDVGGGGVVRREGLGKDLQRNVGGGKDGLHLRAEVSLLLGRGGSGREGGSGVGVFKHPGRALVRRFIASLIRQGWVLVSLAVLVLLSGPWV